MCKSWLFVVFVSILFNKKTSFYYYSLHVYAIIVLDANCFMDSPGSLTSPQDTHSISFNTQWKCGTLTTFQFLWFWRTITIIINWWCVVKCNTDKFPRTEKQSNAREAINTHTHSWLLLTDLCNTTKAWLVVKESIRHALSTL